MNGLLSPDDWRTSLETALAVERGLVSLVDPIHDTRLWDEHLTRIERLERLLRKASA